MRLDFARNRIAAALLLLVCSADALRAGEGDPQIPESKFRSRTDLRVYAVMVDGAHTFIGYSQNSTLTIPACQYWYVAPGDKGEGATHTVPISGPNAGKNPPRIHEGGLRAILDEVRDMKIPGLSLKECKGIKDGDLAPIAEFNHLKLLHMPIGVSDAAFESIPTLTALEELDLADTAFSDGVMGRLPPLTATLKHLALPDKTSEAALLSLARAMPSLRELSVGFNIGAPGLTKLADVLPNLLMLELRGRNVNNDTLAVLPRFKMLTELTVRSNGVTGKGLENLKGLNALHTLRFFLPFNERQSPPLAFAGSDLSHLKNLPALESLQIRPSAIGDAGMAKLAELKLKRLELESPDITDAGLACLKGATAMTHLSLNDCPKITDAGIANLKEMTRMQVLMLWKCPLLTDAAIPYLKGMTELKRFERHGTLISPAGMLALSHIKGLADIMPKRVGVEWKGEMEISESNFPLTDASLAALVQSTQFYTSMSFEDNKHVTDAGLAVLENAKTLRKLRFYNMDLSALTLRHLAANPALRRLEITSSEKLRDADLSALEDSAIEDLKLSQCEGITDASVAHLLKMKNLRALNLGGTKITDNGVRQLVSMPALSNLCVRQAQITDACLEHFKKMPLLAELDIDWTPTTPKLLAGLKALPNLKGLRIGSLNVTDQSLAALKDLSQLEKLAIRYSDITDAGLANLSALINLHELDLHECKKLTDKGMAHLRGLNALVKFGIPPAITDAGLNELADAPIAEFLNEGNMTFVTWQAKSRFLEKNARKPAPIPQPQPERAVKPPRPPPDESF